jgi:hypothetical protein
MRGCRSAQERPPNRDREIIWRQTRRTGITLQWERGRGREDAAGLGWGRRIRAQQPTTAHRQPASVQGSLQTDP